MTEHTTTAFVKAKKAYVKTDKLTVSKSKESPKRTDIKNPLTTEQKDELKDLLNEWVITSNLAKKPINFGGAWNKLFVQGLGGAVNALAQIEQYEFDICVKYIKRQIMIIESTSKTDLTRYKSNWRQKHIGTIHDKCRKQGITGEKRKAFMLVEWGKDSLTLLTDDELRECYQYANRPKPSWIPVQREPQGTQQLREKSFDLLLNKLAEQAKAVNCIFDRNSISLTKDYILSMLFEQDKTLWIGTDKNMIEPATFNRFLTTAKMCKFKAGRR